jgi:hypothetical protein
MDPPLQPDKEQEASDQRIGSMSYYRASTSIIFLERSIVYVSPAFGYSVFLSQNM